MPRKKRPPGELTPHQKYKESRRAIVYLMHNMGNSFPIIARNLSISIGQAHADYTRAKTEFHGGTLHPDDSLIDRLYTTSDEVFFKNRKTALTKTYEGTIARSDIDTIGSTMIEELAEMDTDKNRATAQLKKWRNRIDWLNYYVQKDGLGAQEELKRILSQGEFEATYGPLETEEVTVNTTNGPIKAWKIVPGQVFAPGYTLAKMLKKPTGKDEFTED